MLLHVGQHLKTGAACFWYPKRWWSIECLPITQGFSPKWWSFLFLTCWSCWSCHRSALCFYFFVISRGNFWSKFSSYNIFVLVCAFVISPSSFKHSAFNFASCFFLIKDASACCSTTRIFSWIALSFEYSFEDLEFDNLEPVNLDGLDLLSFFYSAVSSFSRFWILSLKEKFLSPTSFSKPQLFSVVIIYFYHFLIDLFNQFQYVNQLLKLLPFCCFILMRI